MSATGSRTPIERPHRLPWFSSGDIDGFFGLFFSGFPDLLLIVGVAPVCGFTVRVCHPTSPARGRHFCVGGEPVLRMAGSPARRANRSRRRDSHSVRREYTHDFCICLPHHGSCLCAYAFRDACLASRSVCQPHQRSSANRWRVLYRLVAKAYTACSAVVPARGTGSCLSLPWVHLRSVRPGIDRIVADAGVVYSLRIQTQTAMAITAGTACNRGRRAACGHIAVASCLQRALFINRDARPVSTSPGKPLVGVSSTRVVALPRDHSAPRLVGYPSVTPDSRERKDCG